MVISPTLPATATSAAITVAPATSGDARLFDLMTEELSSKPTRGARVMDCVLIYFSLATTSDEDVAFGANDPTLQALFLHVCLRVALALPTKQGARLSASSTPTACSQADKRIAVRITRSGAGYRAQVHARTHNVSRRSSALVISCSHQGNGLQITIRPRARNRTLLQTVGSTLGIGFTNPTTGSTVNVRTTFQIK